MPEMEIKGQSQQEILCQKKRTIKNETNHTELKSKSLSGLFGRNLMMPVPRPKLERLTIIPTEEISAVANPTSSEE